MASQVISKKRVTDYGEVFTAEREVNAMLDLVKNETERMESRFLEPACGTGNFLVEILKRKLDTIKKRYSKNQSDYEKYAVLAISSIYGVDILLENVQTCRDRLLGIFTHFYLNNYKKEFKPECLKTAEYILDRNILWGDALTLRTPDEKPIPIIFSEWSLVNGGMIKRRDFQFAELADFDPKRPTLFSLREVSDTGETVFSPMPVKEYPLVHFLSLNYEDTK